jgi:uroporphyrinogen decarboxylase
MGVAVEFGDGGPELPEPVRDAGASRRCDVFDPAREIRSRARSSRRCAGSRATAAVSGSAALRGRSRPTSSKAAARKSFAVIKEMMVRDRETLRRLLDLLADVAAEVLSFQIASGAGRFSSSTPGPASSRARTTGSGRCPRPPGIAGIRRRPRRPVCSTSTAAAHLLEAHGGTGADALSIDWRTPLSEARRRLPGSPSRETSTRACSWGAPRRSLAERAR